MSDRTFSPTFRENEEGDVVPSYAMDTPNGPIYPGVPRKGVPIEDMPHDFSMLSRREIDNVASIDNIPREASDAVEIEAAKSRHPASLGRTALVTVEKPPLKPKLTSAQQNANATRDLKAHRARTAHEKQIKPGQRM